MNKFALTLATISVYVYIQKQLRLTIAEAIIKCSYAILAPPVAVWEPGLC